jgi:hypothetical protein
MLASTIAADACGNKYMFEPKMMPPHITVCYFTADDITPIEHIISKYNLGCYTFALHFVTESACKKQLFHCAICSMK